MLKVGAHLHSEKGGDGGILAGVWSLAEAGENLAGGTSYHGGEGTWEAGVEDGWKMGALTTAEEEGLKIPWSAYSSSSDSGLTESDSFCCS